MPITRSASANCSRAKSEEKAPAMSRLQGLSSNIPLACSEVATSAPHCSASASTCALALASLAPRPAMMTGFSLSAIICTSRAVMAGSGSGPCGIGR